MNLEEFRDYCLEKKGVTEGFPFDNETLVFKVSGKIFALCGVENFDSINLKCDPELAVELREQYDCVKPGYHMNKKHWNTIELDGSVGVKKLKEWTDHSYDLVVGSLAKKEREKLSN